MSLEQPEATTQTTSEASDGFADVLTNGLKGLEGAPQSDPQTQEATDNPTEVQAQGTPEEKAFQELIVGEQKIPFKTKEEFDAFLEANPTLKAGFMKEADYRRKTQELAEGRKQFEERFQQIEKTFEGASEESRQALGQAFRGFQMATQEQAAIAESVIRDLNLIAQGMAPTGLLGQSKQASNVPPELSGPLGELNSKTQRLENELARLRHEQTQRERQSQETAQRREYDEAVSQVQTWLSEKQGKGIVVSEEERKVMGMFAGQPDAITGKPISLDEAYDLALARLGKTQKIAAQKVFQSSKDAQKRSPLAPTSKPSSQQPEPKTYADVFKQAM